MSGFGPCRIEKRTDIVRYPDHQGELMKFIASAAAVLCLSAAAVTAQTLDDLKNEGKNTDNILTYGMGYHQQRYSPLDKINKTSVRRLCRCGI